MSMLLTSYNLGDLGIFYVEPFRATTVIERLNHRCHGYANITLVPLTHTQGTSVRGSKKNHNWVFLVGYWIFMFAATHVLRFFE
jgi:hypothetical protein